MKAVSLWQPWASLLAGGVKQIETRSWPTKHRGPLLIHAAAASGADVLTACRADIRLQVGCMQLGYHPAETSFERWFDAMPRGGIVGECVVDACIPADSIGWDYGRETRPSCQIYFDQGSTPPLCLAWHQQKDFGDFRPGRWAWLCSAFRAYDLRPCRGRQRLFDVPDSPLAVLP